MKILKVLGIVLLLIILALIIAGLMSPAKFDVTRTVTIDAPRNVVYNYINNFAARDTWSPWTPRDPEMVTKLTGTDGTVGAIQSWEGEINGTGEQEFTAMKENERVDTELRFTKPYHSKANGRLVLEDDGGNTKVTWGLAGDNSFMMRMFMPFMGMDMDKAIGGDFEEGLSNLKGIVESAAKKMADYKIQVVDMPERNFLGIRDKIPMDQLKSFYEKSFGELMPVLTNSGAKMKGMPCGVYYTWDEEKKETELAASIPVDRPVKASENVSYFDVKGGKALMIDYRGPYEEAEKAHMAMDKYMKSNNMKFRGPVVEEYITDPGEEPDQSKWQTNIYYYIDM